MLNLGVGRFEDFMFCCWLFSGNMAAVKGLMKFSTRGMIAFFNHLFSPHTVVC